MRRPRADNRGFTLIELVMVIVIIGVLSAIIVPNFVDYVAKSSASTTCKLLSGLFGAGTLPIPMQMSGRICPGRVGLGRH